MQAEMVERPSFSDISILCILLEGEKMENNWKYISTWKNKKNNNEANGSHITGVKVLQIRILNYGKKIS